MLPVLNRPIVELTPEHVLSNGMRQAMVN